MNNPFALGLIIGAVVGAVGTIAVLWAVLDHLDNDGWGMP
jgi:hypothetical protein